MSNLSKFPKNDEYFKSDTLQGVFPKKWNVKKFKYLFKFNKGLTITKENLQDKGIPCVNYGEVHSKYGFEVNPDKHQLKCVSLEYVDKFSKSLLEFGDFVFADTSEDIEGSGNFTQLIADQVVFAGYHTVIARPIKNHHYRYLAYLFDSVAFRNQVRRLVKGVKVFTISQAILKNTFLWLPSNKEQIAIAKFLDEKTAKIDEAIAIKEKQIELLKERKQILIQNAVTCGLDPNVPMKDSGVEWIGKIPQHWKVEKLFGLCRFVRGNSAFAKDELLSNGKYVALQYGKTYKVDEVDASYEFYVNEEFYKESQVVIFGDVIFISTSETIEDLGHSAIYNRGEVGLIGGEQLLIKPKNDLLDYYYIYYSTKVFSKELRKYATGIKVFRFNINNLKTIYTVVPPKEEQEKIVRHISTYTKKINKAISLQESQIEKLEEYKSTLINSAVTGKIKVH